MMELKKKQMIGQSPPPRGSDRGRLRNAPRAAAMRAAR
jgi:hypothetical protein